MNPHITRAVAVAALAALAACSGGGTALTPGSALAHAPAATGNATLTFTRLAPQAGTAAKQRRTNEFSFGANSLVIDAVQTGAAPLHAVYDISGAAIGTGLNCTSDASGDYQTCTTQVLLPLGTDTVTVATNSARDGSGTTLGSATMQLTVIDKQNNPFAITLDGHVASMKLFVSDPKPATGTAVNLPLTVQLYDATGTVLIAPQNYPQPVIVSDPDTTSATSLFTVLSQNSTQRYNGTGVSSSPSPTAKTVSVPDRYTQPFLAYDGTSSNAVTITAAFGALSASATITPSAPAARPAGTAGHTYALPSTQARVYDPLFDTAGNLWTTVSGGAIASLDPSTRQITATYKLPATSVRSYRAIALGPDGAIWGSSGTVSNGATTAPWYVTRFDPNTHAFTDYPTNDQVLHLVKTPSGLWGAERTISKLWQLPFSGTTPAATANEYADNGPAVTDTTPVLAPLPTRVFPASDGNLWVVDMSYATVNGAWLAKYTPAGVKLSEVRVNMQKPTAVLEAEAIDANGGIWFNDETSQNEYDRYDTATSTLTTYAVPRLYGNDSGSSITTYATVDAAGNLFFINNLDGRIGRIDLASGRVDELGGPGGNYYGITIAGTTLVLDGYTSASPFVFTDNTQ